VRASGAHAERAASAHLRGEWTATAAPTEVSTASRSELMMKKVLVAFVAVVLAGLPAAVMAATDQPERVDQLGGAVAMTDAEMDQITAGALLTVTVAGNDILNNNRVGVNAAANAAIGVLGNAAACCAAARLTQ
jgi:hypothetical protein